MHHFLLPAPRDIQLEPAMFVLNREACIVMNDVSQPQMRTAARQLQAEILHNCGLHLSITAGAARDGDIALQCVPDAPEGYKLQISATGIRITAGDGVGVLHGVQTLRQLIRSNITVLRCLTIEDAPAFRYRGFYHDVTRGRVPTLDWLKKLADECCYYKLNQLQLYVEHTYLFRDLPELMLASVTPLTAEEIIELDEYCAERGIELVPSLSTFGHLFVLLETDRFNHLCELPDAGTYPATMPNRMAHHTIDPTNPEAQALILSMIDEYMSLFTSRHFNICADETFDLGKGRNRGRDERELYMGFVKMLCEHVVSRGRTPMFWGDIVLKFPDALKELPEGTICLNWGYAADVTEDNTRILAQAGARQYVCPGVSGWNQWTPRLRTAYENIRRMAEYGVRYGAAGLLNTDWGDYGHINDPRLSMPGLVMGACAAWTGTLPACDELLQQISLTLYGCHSGGTCALLADLAETQVYSWWHIVRHMDKVKGELSDPWASPREEPVDRRIFCEAQERIRRIQESLALNTLLLPREMRPMRSCWQVAADAIRLWNEAYHLTLMGEKSPETAVALLHWLVRYEKQWYEVSKESELRQIRDVTAWYASQLT